MKVRAQGLKCFLYNLKHIYLFVCLFVFSTVYLHCCLFEICASDSDIDLSFIYSVPLSCVFNVPAEENRNKNDLHLRSWQLWDYVDG